MTERQIVKDESDKGLIESSSELFSSREANLAMLFFRCSH